MLNRKRSLYPALGLVGALAVCVPAAGGNVPPKDCAAGKCAQLRIDDRFEVSRQILDGVPVEQAQWPAPSTPGQPAPAIQASAGPAPASPNLTVLIALAVAAGMLLHYLLQSAVARRRKPALVGAGPAPRPQPAALAPAPAPAMALTPSAAPVEEARREEPPQAPAPQEPTPESATIEPVAAVAEPEARDAAEVIPELPPAPDEPVLIAALPESAAAPELMAELPEPALLAEEVPVELADTSEASEARVISLLAEEAIPPASESPDIPPAPAAEDPAPVPAADVRVEAPALEPVEIPAPVVAAVQIEAPVSEAPVMESPAVGAPVMEAPAIEAPEPIAEVPAAASSVEPDLAPVVAEEVPAAAAPGQPDLEASVEPAVQAPQAEAEPAPPPAQPSRPAAASPREEQTVALLRRLSIQRARMTTDERHAAVFKLIALGQFARADRALLDLENPSDQAMIPSWSITTAEHIALRRERELQQKLDGLRQRVSSDAGLRRLAVADAHLRRSRLDEAAEALEELEDEIAGA